MKGFVLAAGIGTRMRPVTDVVPKPLLPIGQLPLIGYALRLLAAHDIREVIVNTHHLGALLKDQLGDGSAYGVSIVYSDEEEILGTGGALKRMQSQLDDTFVVLNSDTVIDLDLSAAIRAHHKSEALATMVLREDPNFARYGAIEVDQDNRVRRILGQGKTEVPLRGLMFTGTHVLSPRFLEYLPPEVESCVVRYGYQKALDNDEVISGYTHGGAWMDAGTPERFFLLHDTALGGELLMDHAEPMEAPEGESGVPEGRDSRIFIAPSASVAASAELRAPVSIGPHARVGSSAVIGPSTVVRARASVAKRATVERSVILSGVRVESESIVKNSIVGKKSTLSLNEGTTVE